MLENYIDEFNNFLNYWPEWADMKCIKIVNKSKSKFSIIHIFIDKNNNSYQIHLDDRDSHILCKTIKKILKMLNIPNNENKEYWEFKLNPDKLRKFINFVSSRSDTTHIIGCVQKEQTAFYQIAFKGNLVD